MLDFAGFAVEDHQARFVALVGGVFRQQFGRKVVVGL
jgi:hypothetical protein